MTDSPRPTRIKVIRKSMKASPDQTESLLWGDCLFCTDAAMTDYDWVLVYDEFPRTPVGTIRNETEPLLCPPDQTILITVEPPSIKIYSRAYTSQFGTVLTTHSARDLPHPGHTLGRGCLEWLYIKPMQEILDQKEFPKTKMLSTICSAKQHTHTMHKKRYDLTRYLADRLPELDWFGHGIREIENKTVAMDDYKYHLCVENHLEPHHWTEKLSDAFVAMTLPFYAGDPLATECFPQESFIPIPLDNPQKALEIIRKAMEDGEYEKRLPAIREARRLVLEKYNMFAQTAAVIHNHRETGTIRPGAMLKGRHVLRKIRSMPFGNWQTPWPIKSDRSADAEPAPACNLDSGRAPTGGNKFPLPVKRMGGQYSANCLAADGTAQPGLKPIQTGRETGH